jgi:hypothetical protein
MDNAPAPQTLDQLERKVAALQKQLGPTPQTEQERKRIQDEINRTQAQLDNARRAHERDRVATAARNRGDNPHRAVAEYDETVKSSQRTQAQLGQRTPEQSKQIQGETYEERNQRLERGSNLGLERDRDNPSPHKP